jgi:hypothetical protein
MNLISRKKFLAALVFCFLIAELVTAKTSTRMRRSKLLTAVASTANLSWSPSSSFDDFQLGGQSFILTNSGTATADNLSFSVPVLLNKFAYLSASNTFVITSSTCGTSLNAGASCTMDIEFFPCNDNCTQVLPSICTGVVTATSNSVSASLTNLLYNCGMF